VASGRWQILLIDFAKQNFATRKMVDFTYKFYNFCPLYFGKFSLDFASNKW
jgi:hypothetical protein